MSFADIGTPWFYDIGTGLAFLATLAGLGAGHLIGEFVLQSDADTAGKTYPSNDRLASGVRPWTGWTRCLNHTRWCLAAQAAALVIVLPVISLSPSGSVAALAISGSTHAVIDRGWVVHRIIAAKRGTTSGPDARVRIGQALHAAAMFVAAVTAARTTTVHETALAVCAALLLIVCALHVEHRHARGVTAGPAPTDRY